MQNVKITTIGPGLVSVYAQDVACRPRSVMPATPTKPGSLTGFPGWVAGLSGRPTYRYTRPYGEHLPATILFVGPSCRGRSRSRLLGPRYHLAHRRQPRAGGYVV